MIEILNLWAGVWWNWMAAATIQVTVLVILVAVADRLLRRWAWPQLQLVIWLLVLGKLILPPGLTSPISLTSALTAVDLPANGPTGKGPESPGDPSPLRSPPKAAWAPDLSREESVGVQEEISLAHKVVAPHPAKASGSALRGETWLMILWATGVLFLNGALVLRLRWLKKRLSDTSRKPPERVREAVGTASALVGLRKPPGVVSTEALSAPAVFGVLHPVVFLPSGYPGELSEEDLRNTLVHEAMHVRWRDLLLQRMLVLVLTLYWFHPLLWLVRGRLQQLQELCCDARVARVLQREIRSYRDTLVRASRRLLETSAPAGLETLGLLERGSRIGERLEWLKRHSPEWGRARLAVTVAVAAGMVLSVLPMAKPAVVTKSQAPTGFTVLSVQTYSPAGRGNTYLSEVRVRFQKADGQWRSFRARFDSESEEIRFVSADGGSIPAKFDCEAIIRAHPDFRREETILGQLTLVEGSLHRDGAYMETFLAPGFRCLPLRRVLVSNRGLDRIEPLRIEVGSPLQEAFAPLPDITIYNPEEAEPKKGQLDREIKARFPAVWQLIRQELPRFQGLTTLQDYARGQREVTRSLAATLSEGIPMPELMEEYPYQVPLPGRIGPAGSIFLQGSATSEIHRCEPNGRIVANYFLGTPERFLQAVDFRVDALGRVDALLAPLPQPDFRTWIIRHFETPDVYSDIELSLGPDLFRVVGLGKSGAGDYLVLVRKPSHLVLYQVAADGSTTGSLDLRGLVPDEPDWEPSTGKFTRPFPGPSFEVLSDGTIYLLFRSIVTGEGPPDGTGLAMRAGNQVGVLQGPFTLSGDLYRIDFASASAERVSLEPPFEEAALLAIHGHEDRLLLEWTAYALPGVRAQRTLPAMPWGLFTGSVKELTVLEDGHQTPLVQTEGRVVAASMNRLVVAPAEGFDGPRLRLVRLSD